MAQIPLQQSGGGAGGTTLTGTGIARNTGACTELSGDVTTSGSNAASVVKVNGASVPASKAVVGTNGSGQIIDATATTLPTTMVPAFTGDVTNSAGSLATSVVKVNGASVPASATILGSNGGGQLVDNSANLANIKIATLTLSSAQIKALFTTPIQIIAAPGAGLAINVWFVVWNYIAGGTGYATATGTFQLADAGLHFTIGGVTGTNLGVANASTNGLSLVVGTGNFSIDTNYVNTSRVVWISTANPTTGNGTITIKVFYTIDTVS